MRLQRLMRASHKSLLVALGWAALVAAQAASGVYKWVDRDGVARYDDHSLLAERLTRATIARGTVAADAKATVPAEIVHAVAQQCLDLKERTGSYAEARVVFGRDPAGNQYRFSANQLALEVATLREQAQRYCRPLAAQYLLAEARAELQRDEAARNAQSRRSAAPSGDSDY